MTSFPKDIKNEQIKPYFRFLPSSLSTLPVQTIEDILSNGIYLSNIEAKWQKLLKTKPSEILCEDRYEKFQNILTKCAFEDLKKYFLISEHIEYKALNNFDMNFEIKERDITYLNTLLNILNYKRKEFCIVGSSFENQTIKSKYSISFINCAFINTKVECSAVCCNSLLKNSYFEKYDISSNYSYWASNKYKFHKKHHFYNKLKELKEKLQLNIVLEYCEESSISKALF